MMLKIDNNHNYYIEIPGVTSIIDEMLGDDGLKFVKDLDFYRDRGTRVHSLIEEYTKTNEIPLVIESTLKPFFDAFYDFKETNNFHVKTTEQLLHSINNTDIPEKYRNYFFAGTVDAVAKLDNKLVVIDYKTSSSIYSKRYYFQIGAYCWLTGLDEGYLLQLKEDGTHKLKKVDPKYKQMFLDMLEAYYNFEDYVMEKKNVKNKNDKS